jgi:protein phosphatase inhibitor 2
MNILQTLHPADKDYGHMKIEEPKTPFNYYSDNPEGEEQHLYNESHAFDPNALANKMSKEATELPKILAESDDESDESDDENLTEDEKKKKKEFEVKRKMHYNEFQAVKLARKLLEEEDEEDDEDIGDDKCADNAENGNQDVKLSSNPEEAIDETLETSGNEQIDSQDIDNVHNR